MLTLSFSVAQQDDRTVAEEVLPVRPRQAEEQPAAVSGTTGENPQSLTHRVSRVDQTAADDPTDANQFQAPFADSFPQWLPRR
jgi:hypothetical protein